MTRPPWLDPALYPFTSHYLDVGAGRMHYLDEGAGTPVVMVHGTPSWSFLYRHLVRDLESEYRCLAPDHLGFGLSDKPSAFPYTPMAHAENLEAFIGALGLKDIVLVVHDFGGPIGFSYALEHPENVRALVVMNTWLWPFASLGKVGKVLGNPLGRFLYKRLNVSVEVLAVSADRSVLTKPVLEHYRGPFPTPASREPLWALVATIGAANGWFDSLWRRRSLIADKPALLLWGTKDKLVPLEYLGRWRAVFSHAQTLELDSGHFIQEEAGPQVGETVGRFLRALEGNGS